MRFNTITRAPDSHRNREGCVRCGLAPSVDGVVNEHAAGRVVSAVPDGEVVPGRRISGLDRSDRRADLPPRTIGIAIPGRGARRAGSDSGPRIERARWTNRFRLVHRSSGRARAPRRNSFATSRSARCPAPGRMRKRFWRRRRGRVGETSWMRWSFVDDEDTFSGREHREVGMEAVRGPRITAEGGGGDIGGRQIENRRACGVHRSVNRSIRPA